MEKARHRLESSLASAPLNNKLGLKELIHRQLLSSPPLHMSDEEVRLGSKSGLDDTLNARLQSSWECLNQLRGASGDHPQEQREPTKEWMVKEETDNMRTMFRKGRVGTSCHTYSTEGIIEGSLVNALCVLWEVPSYKEWWPKFNFPRFKVQQSESIKRSRTCEELSYIRVKLPWPVEYREVLMSTFLVECVEQDLIFVFIKTVPLATQDIEERISGFNNLNISYTSKSSFRPNVNGAFVIQKMSSSRSYARLVLDLDFKIDYAPTWVFDFVSRRLIGYGHKLFNKVVLSMDTNNYFKDLINKAPLYNQIKIFVRQSRGHLHEDSDGAPYQEEEEEEEGEEAIFTSRHTCSVH